MVHLQKRGEDHFKYILHDKVNKQEKKINTVLHLWLIPEQNKEIIHDEININSESATSNEYKKIIIQTII